MSFRRNRKALYLLAAFSVSPLIFYFLNQTIPKKNTEKNIPPSATGALKIIPISPLTSTSTTPKPVPEKESEYELCVFRILDQIAGKCDDRCLIAHVRKKDPELALELEEIRDPFSDSKRPSRSRIGRLVRSFNGFYPQPWKVMEKVAKEDPDNAYPAFYHASLVYGFNDNPAAREILIEALQRKKYINYYTDYFLRLRKATINDPALFARAMRFNQRVFKLNASILWNLETLDNDLYLQLGKRITKPALDADGWNPDVTWSAYDYVMGKHMIEDSDSTEASFMPEYEFDLSDDNNYYPELAKDCKAESFYRAMVKIKKQINAK